MKKTALVTMLIFLMAYNNVNAHTRLNVLNKVDIGLQGGFSFFTQDITELSHGDPGLIFGGNISYNITNLTSLGLDIETETHTIKILNDDIGKTRTVSIIPFVKIRDIESGIISPYWLLGVGVNLNSFDEASIIKGIEFKPKNTVALKVGMGMDYFMKNSLFAFNWEFGWKFNTGEMKVQVLGLQDTIDFDGNIVYFFIGIRGILEDF